MDESLLISIGIGFVTTLIVTPYFKKFLEKIGIVATDKQKKKPRCTGLHKIING